jgi:hypothetical protein
MDIIDEGTESVGQPQNAPEWTTADVELSRERVFEYPFPAVDALIEEVLPRWLKPYYVKVRRRQLSTGSVRYTLLSDSSNKDLANKEVASLFFRMVDIKKTLFRLESKPDIGMIIHRYLIRHLPAHVAAILGNESQIVKNVAQYQRQHPEMVKLQQELQALQHEQEPSRRGRPVKNDNEWVRQEIKRGQDREEVFDGYLQRQLVDTNNKNAILQARSRFNKILSRTK